MQKSAKPKKGRLDELLVKRGFFADTDQALRSIIANEVLVDDVPARSGGQMVSDACGIRLRGERQFVSRGGNKLDAAIRTFGVDVSGMRAIDVGSSTGGFTDCLLQHGAKSVACVDVNYSQLAWSIRQDERVAVFERTNIKQAEPVELGAPFDIIVIDVSFISLASLADVLARLARQETILIALVKPQFESRHEETVSGVVLDEEVRQRTLEEVCIALRESGFAVIDSMTSPVRGPAGNVEYLVLARYLDGC